MDTISLILSQGGYPVTAESWLDAYLDLHEGNMGLEDAVEDAPEALKAEVVSLITSRAHPTS